MQEIKRTLSYGLASVLALGVLSGCATQSNTAKAPESKPAMAAQPAALAAAPAPAAAAQPATASTQHYFLVFHENGRIYPIADAKNYLAFLDVNELIYTRTRVGEGPAGETLVFGIEKKEADDLNKPAKAELLYDGKMDVSGPFYGEVVKDGRFHVFGTWQDFKDYLVNKEITYTFTEVGTGPKGETVIYAMNKKTSADGRPVALIESFKKFHSIK
ncbi:MAG: hypothetical protein Q8R61_03000 [Thiobacillus sp.]|uniref:hypothetical protein n=1 Tax=Thiobacillus sp. TaxID=924 RepID=UPI002734C5E0|nr:hypothetical protein [Thiobacillus sp.]MDP3419845.1 hypothetical protein [Thiobacillus sp.]MDP3584066.1 hypothetical protein [Thiobacillus sp.]